jgi:hypothetical protein
LPSEFFCALAVSAGRPFEYPTFLWGRPGLPRDGRVGVVPRDG